VFGQLHRGRADGSRRADDHDVLAGLDLSQVSQVIQRGIRAEWNRNGFLPTQRIRLDHHRPGFRQARVLSVPTACHSGRGNNSITILESRNVLTRSLHLPSQLGPEDACVPGLSDTEHQFRDGPHRPGDEREIANVAVTS
jgi:hypothetical protein